MWRRGEEGGSERTFSALTDWSITSASLSSDSASATRCSAEKVTSVGGGAIASRTSRMCWFTAWRNDEGP